MDNQPSDSLLKALLAPILQPQAQLGLTGQETATSGQQQQTSAQEQKTSAQQQQNLITQQPGEQATSSIDQLNAIKTAAPFQAAKAIQGGMTWNEARKTYAKLGMSADDTFKQYLQNNPYGLPRESPTTLISQGVKPETLGQIGQNGSFADRQNTGGAINDLRIAEDLWNKITPGDVLQYKLTGQNANVNNYNIQKRIAGEHYVSAISGASGAQGTGEANVGLLPDPGNLTSYGQNVATGAFSTLENSILGTKRYAPQDVGLTSRPQEKTNSTGGDVLNGILNTVKSTNDAIHNPLGFLATAQIKSGVNDAIDTTNKVMHDTGQGAKNPLDALLNTGKAAQDIITPQRVGGDVIAALGARYAPAVLSKVFGDGGAEATAEAITPKQTGTSNIPSNFMTKINPQGTMNAGTALKNTATGFIDKNKIPVKGADINAQIQNERDNLEMQFSGISKADIDQALTNVESSFKDKNLTAAQAEKIYDGIPRGYTATGIEKEDFNSQLAQIKRQAISDAIEKAGPGKGWKQGVQAQAKAFSAQKGQIAKTKQNVLPRAVGAGLGIVGLDSIRHVLGL